MFVGETPMESVDKATSKQKEKGSLIIEESSGIGMGDNTDSDGLPS